jgi:hypothetical protein
MTTPSSALTEHSACLAAAYVVILMQVASPIARGRDRICEDCVLASQKNHHALVARRLGQRAARRMALLSATVPYDEVDDACYREAEFLDMAVDVTAEGLALARGRSRSRFEAAVNKSLNEETDRILTLIARGSTSPQ